MDTITAISTPPGEGGISVIRISGDRSLEVTDKIFRGGSLPSKNKSHTVIHGEIYDGQDLVDEVLVTIMKAPRTYTGEDVVEISCHGGRITANRILRTILNNGIRLADHGEFTLRAFLNGKIDLIQAEAIADIVNAKSEKAQQYALSSMKGELSERIKRIKNSLKEIQMLIETCLNFSDEVIIDEKGIYTKIKKIKSQIEVILDGAQYGRYIKDGISIPIVGRTNVGKSTLFNKILKQERSIVTSIPGTTRDVIEETLNIDGIQVIFMDTCGIRTSKDDVEIEGINRARKVINKGDLVLWLIDQSQPLNEEDIEFLNILKQKDTIAVFNKCDIKRNGNYDIPFKAVSVSARTGENIQKLINLIKEKFLYPSVNISIIKERHINILNIVHKNLQDALKTGMLELAASDVGFAIEALREMTGETASQGVIESIFSKFCIGK